MMMHVNVAYVVKRSYECDKHYLGVRPSASVFSSMRLLESPEYSPDRARATCQAVAAGQGMH